jgi:decaprenylphospho-beta-D-erythro-pentofuranosid-2-ulose 2-reductase
MATHCARLWSANQACSFTLIGRNFDRLERVANDLKARSPMSDVTTRVVDFCDPDAITELVTQLSVEAKVDVALIAHGSLGDQAVSQQNLQVCKQELEINGISPVLFAEAFATTMAASNHGTLALIGSVAGDRGRRSNYIYGAAKGLVTRYAQGLHHRFAGTGVCVVLIKPGPTATPMTAALVANGAKMAQVEDVAREIVLAIDRGQPLAYVPRKWSLIMQVIRHLPRAIFNKMNI